MGVMKSLVILVVAVCFAKLAYAATDDKKHTTSEPKKVNKITPREYIARRVLIELNNAGVTVSSQKVSFYKLLNWLSLLNIFLTRLVR